MLDTGRARVLSGKADSLLAVTAPERNSRIEHTAGQLTRCGPSLSFKVKVQVCTIRPELDRATYCCSESAGASADVICHTRDCGTCKH